jgi:hypothetical protein
MLHFPCGILFFFVYIFGIVFPGYGFDKNKTDSALITKPVYGSVFLFLTAGGLFCASGTRCGILF